MRLTALLFSLGLPLNALTIQIDYSLDSNRFFSSAGNPRGATGAAQARAALEAAAARWSAIINETLDPVEANDHPTRDVRMSFPDPSNFDPSNIDPVNNPTAIFETYEISSAASSATDSLVSPGLRPPANQYDNGISIPANTFIIYVGARPLPNDAFTAGFIGNNHPSVIDDGDSLLNRGFNSGNTSLPTWGSSISFNSAEDFDDDPSGILERKWHFDHTSSVALDSKDFYSIALTEIGHALGVGLLYHDWKKFILGSRFIGPFTRNAYLEEYGSPTVALDLQEAPANPDDPDDPDAPTPSPRYFRRGAYTSKIFTGGNPNYVDTVGPGVPQQLLFEAPRDGHPATNIVPGIPYGLRYEITNIDVGAVRDLGWSVIASAPEHEVSFVTLTRSSIGHVTLTFPSEDGVSYTVQTSTDSFNWMNVTPELNSEGTTTDWRDGEIGFTDPLGSSFARRKKFYRVLKND